MKLKVAGPAQWHLLKLVTWLVTSSTVAGMFFQSWQNHSVWVIQAATTAIIFTFAVDVQEESGTGSRFKQKHHGLYICAPSVVPAAKLKPMAARQVFPARVYLEASTEMVLMSRKACLKSMSPASNQ